MKDAPEFPTNVHHNHHLIIKNGEVARITAVATLTVATTAAMWKFAAPKVSAWWNRLDEKPAE